jgi:thiamine-monophosphate kinase
MGHVTNPWAMVYLGAPGSTSSTFLNDFFQGVKETAEKYGCALAGGDTVKARELTLVSAVGGEMASRPITRQGAEVGDALCVAGPVGDADVGLKILLGQKNKLGTKEKAFFVRRFFSHTPRFVEGKILGNTSGVTSMIDLSDSLQESIELLLGPSSLGALLELSTVPLSPLYRKHVGASSALLGGGEDYALLFTVHPSAVQTLKKKMKFSVIGQVTPRSTGFNIQLNGAPVKRPRYFSQF